MSFSFDSTFQSLLPADDAHNSIMQSFLDTMPMPDHLGHHGLSNGGIGGNFQHSSHDTLGGHGIILSDVHPALFQTDNSSIAYFNTPPNVAAPIPVPAYDPFQYDGFPTWDMFQQVLAEYFEALSPKKRDKALIVQDRYHNIKKVLRNPKSTATESAQFRFWAKKMFELKYSCNGPVVCHEGKPVAVREQMYRVLINAHRACSHGGRDKTSAQVRQKWSWVPKELIARFVRFCPTCRARRPAHHNRRSNTAQQKRKRASKTASSATARNASSIASQMASPPQYQSLHEANQAAGTMAASAVARALQQNPELSRAYQQEQLESQQAQQQAEQVGIGGGDDIFEAADTSMMTMTTSTSSLFEPFTPQTPHDVANDALTGELSMFY